MSCISEEVALEEDRAGLPLPCYAQSPAEMSADRRLGLLTRLQDARIDLERARARRQSCMELATVCRAEADATDNPHRRIALNAASVKAQLEAQGYWAEVWELTQTIGSIERSLSAGPVVLTAEQCSAVDETAGVAA